MPHRRGAKGSRCRWGSPFGRAVRVPMRGPRSWRHPRPFRMRRGCGPDRARRMLVATPVVRCRAGSATGARQPAGSGVPGAHKGALSGCGISLAATEAVPERARPPSPQIPAPRLGVPTLPRCSARSPIRRPVGTPRSSRPASHPTMTSTPCSSATTVRGSHANCPSPHGVVGSENDDLSMAE